MEQNWPHSGSDRFARLPIAPRRVKLAIREAAWVMYRRSARLAVARGADPNGPILV